MTSRTPASELDEVIHPARRLAICALLSEVSEAEFATVRDELKISDSSLSKHVSTLRGAGYVRVSKRVDAGRVRTWLALTREGRAAYATHIRALKRMIG